MPDDADRAAELEEEGRSDALAEQQRRAGLRDAATWESTSAEVCDDESCGATLPEARRKALPGVRFCVDCAARQERKRR